MKKIIFSWGGTLLLILFGLTTNIQAQCTGTGNCFDVIYYGPSISQNRVTLKFRVNAKGNNVNGSSASCLALSYIAFQLSSSFSGEVTNIKLKSDIDGEKNIPFTVEKDNEGKYPKLPYEYSLKFEVPDNFDFKDADEYAEFEYELTSLEFNKLPELFKVQIKTGEGLNVGPFYEYTFSKSLTTCPEVLPVTLTKFDGAFNSSGVKLSWETATEINNDRFEVERSANGKDFIKVGEVQGNGNSTVVQKYSFTDNQLLAGILYYRLRQVDYDGKSELSKVIAVESKEVSASNLKVNLFPNPTDGSLIRIRLEGLPQVTDQMNLQLIDMSGKRLYTATLNRINSEFDLSISSLKLKRGVYLVSLSAGELTSRQRLIVQ